MAIEAYPTHSSVIVKYANLLKSVHRNYSKAEHYYQKAIEANPAHAER